MIPFAMYLKCGITMSVVALFLFALTPLLSKWYGSRSLYYSWALVMAGFLIPFRPRFTYTVRNSTIYDSPTTDITNYFPAIQTAGHEAIPAPISEMDLTRLLPVLWIIGFAVVIGYHFMRHYRFVSIIKRWGEDVSDMDMLHILHQEKTRLGVSSKIKMMTCSIVESPMLIGLFSPTILLPKMSTSEDKLALILRHELIHYKRKDLLIKFCTIPVIALHWFNPIMYLMVKAVNTYCEVSCDAEVLQNETVATRVQYCKTILGFAHDKSWARPVLSTNYLPGKMNLEKRLIAIMDAKNKRIGVVIVAAVCVAVLITGATWLPKKEYDKSVYVNVDAAAEAEIVSSRPAVEGEEYAQTTFATHQEFLESFWRINVDIENGKVNPHSIRNGEIAIYTNNGGKWNLTGGDGVEFSLAIDPILVDGHTVEIGYILNGTYVELYCDKVKNTILLNFEAPESGTYDLRLFSRVCKWE